MTCHCGKKACLDDTIAHFEHKELMHLRKEIKEKDVLIDELITMVERGAVIVDALVVKEYLEKYPTQTKH